MGAIGLSWTQLRTFSIDRNLPIVFYIDSGHYYIFVSDGQLAFETRIRIDSPSVGDQLDFETNYQADANDVPMGTKVIGEDGNYAVDVTANKELRISDTHDNGGLDIVLNLTTTPSEGKVGASKKPLRKYVVFEGLSQNIVWGFTNSTQSFDIFKSQLIMVPIGENTEIWFKMKSGTGDVAFGEIS